LQFSPVHRADQKEIIITSNIDIPAITENNSNFEEVQVMNEDGSVIFTICSIYSYHIQPKQFLKAVSLFKCGVEENCLLIDLYFNSCTP